MRHRVLPALAIALFVFAATARAQSPGSFEIGAHFGLVHRQALNPVVPGGTEAGLGGRLAWLATSAIRLEGEVDVFPQDALARGTRTSGLFGVVAGKRGAGMGVFGKARAGFVNFAQAAGLRPGTSSFRATNPAFDVGAVVEAYRFESVTLRFDAGDTLVHLDDIFAPVSPDHAPARSAWRHSLQLSSGVAWRF